MDWRNDQDAKGTTVILDFRFFTVRCSTSVGSNYRAACRAKSDADFLNKLRIVEEESDETSYWLEILEEVFFVEPLRVEKLKREVNEITAIIVASQKTIQNKIRLKKGN